MKNVSINKEDEFNLKNSRLRMLIAASEELVDHNYSECREYLLVFRDTVTIGSNAGKELHDTYGMLEQEFNDGINKMEENVAGTIGGFALNIESDPLHGLPVGDYREEETSKLQRYFARSFHSKCWNVANEHELIPSQ